MFRGTYFTKSGHLTIADSGRFIRIPNKCGEGQFSFYLFYDEKSFLDFFRFVSEFKPDFSTQFYKDICINHGEILFDDFIKLACNFDVCFLHGLFHVYIRCGDIFLVKFDS